MNTKAEAVQHLPETDSPVLFFDGVCNLCNRFVQVVIKQDKKRLFRFASLQSGAGTLVKTQIEQAGVSVPDSLILSYKSRIYYKSDAALKTARLLGGVWSVLLVGYVIPKTIRDGFYDFVAKNRYSWFGKKDECMIPTPELKARFLD